MGLDVKTGISGLDSILSGGLPKHSVSILEGAPGTGKTTLGMQFLYEGAVSHNESGMYITFEELPEQLYADMSSFGWDLKEQERQNKLRIVCITPDILLSEMKKTEGLLDSLIKEIDCKRIVIDSISLLKYSSESLSQMRANVYSLRNVLRKLKVASLLISEISREEESSREFEHYVSDGIITLSIRPFMEKYRERTIEVKKMRGKRVHTGRHRLFITNQGVEILPAMTMVEDRVLITENDMFSTGIADLDTILGGGMLRGSVYILDTNSKAQYKSILGSIYTSRLKAKEKTLVILSSFSSIQNIQDLCKLYHVSLDDAVKEDRAFFIEHYSRPAPAGYEGAIFYAGGLSEEDYRQKLSESLSSKLRKNAESKDDNWFIYYDLNTIFSEHGKDYVQRFFAEEAAFCRANGIVMLALCNFTEIHSETASFLERTSNGVIRTWVDGRYQYLQVTKSPVGHISEPFVINNCEQAPYIRLIMG